MLIYLMLPKDYIIKVMFACPLLLSLVLPNYTFLAMPIIPMYLDKNVRRYKFIVDKGTIIRVILRYVLKVGFL